ncbi:hypothetical protein KI387_019049 [Taxus chinensis]|uniref:AIG1-type G domain-containing protein n=1 Tax=Taxus chinensis TaxID=29808 RepID=A0AA38G8G9_TAXCH|nr:hypothetical protein KI387_019049 [Taxus chinensis]
MQFCSYATAQLRFLLFCRFLGLVSEPSMRNYGKQIAGKQLVGEGFTEEKATLDEDGKQNEFEKLRVKFLRLAHRLGQSTSLNVVVTQVLHRLEIAERLWRNRNFSKSGGLPFEFQRESAIAEQQEASGQGSLEFTCTIMLLGKTGVGKSATINSIFDEARSGTDAFQLGTNKVEEIVGTVEGIEIRVIDTPGLVASKAGQDRTHNNKVLRLVKRIIKKTPPDIVLYFDRLDMQGTDRYGEVSLLRSITETFGAAVWHNAIVVLTHAACPPT